MTRLLLGCSVSVCDSSCLDLASLQVLELQTNHFETSRVSSFELKNHLVVEFGDGQADGRKGLFVLRTSLLMVMPCDLWIVIAHASFSGSCVRSACQQRSSRWHSWKNATQMPAVIVAATTMASPRVLGRVLLEECNPDGPGK